MCLTLRNSKVLDERRIESRWAMIRQFFANRFDNLGLS